MSSFVNESSLPSAVLMVPEPEDHEVTDPSMFLPAILGVKRVLKGSVGLLDLVVKRLICDMMDDVCCASQCSGGNPGSL